MSFGKPMLIENIEEELDPMLDPVLEKRLIKKGKSYIMPMADKEVRSSRSQAAAPVPGHSLVIPPENAAPVP